MEGATTNLQYMMPFNAMTRPYTLVAPWLQLQGPDPEAAFEWLTYATVILVTLRATGLELLDTGASNIGIASATSAHPKLQFFDMGSWRLVRNHAVGRGSEQYIHDGTNQQLPGQQASCGDFASIPGCILGGQFRYV